MAKKPASKRKSTSAQPVWRRLRYWPALIAGVLVAVLGGFLWYQSSQAVFDSQLLQQLPKDSSVAGVARLSRFSADTVNQVAHSTTIDSARAANLAQTLNAAGIDRTALKNALGDQFAFARTTRGDLAIFTVAQESAFADAAGRLTGQLTGRTAGRTSGAGAKTVDLQTNSGTLKIWQGTPDGGQPDGQPSVSAYRRGGELYVATNPDLIVGAVRETNGFTSLDQFAGVSKQLPPGADAYVFVNAAQLKDPPVAFPLTGLAVTDHQDRLRLDVRVADPAVVSKSPPNTDGALLPGAEAASAAVEGTDVAGYLHLLEEQRQESDLPRVITLQNGIAALGRTLGVDLERDFLSRASGRFVYGRYRTADGSEQWFGVARFDSAPTAADTVGQLTTLLRQRVTVPTRHERVRTLPDGTQSREIVSEGNEALDISDVSIEGHGGNAATFPGIGAVNWVTDGEYLVLGSSPEAAARMVRTIAHPSGKPGERGTLAIRAKLSEVPGLFAARDGLFNWILATQPESGSFTLSKSTGELQGAVRFKPAGR